ncbi:alanine racemase [Acinetobacter sp. WZC-1]|uniref:alanine racemase n=1 Tax=Acinetobacter sp. WZC-1 TaxID=3459034 RepID=UPI00403DCD49
MHRLTAHQHPLVRQLLQQHEHTLLTLIKGLGSPLHVVLPQLFAENISHFQQVLTEADIQHSILFAKKSNKANCFVQSCLEHQIGIDVASCGELNKALALGMTGTQVGVSGPDKDAALLQAAMQHGCLIAVDSLGELQQLQQQACHYRKQCRILLRCQSADQPHSRFGLTAEMLVQALHYCADFMNDLHLQGFSFHLSGYDPVARANMASQLIDLSVQARQMGLTDCCCVNIGGGFSVEYVDGQAWQHFQQHNHPAHYHALKNFTDFYPYAGQAGGADGLRQLLETEVSPGLKLRHKIKQQQIHLMLEPGRALLDQAGLSAFRVQGLKPLSADYAVLTVAGTSFSLSEQWFNSEYLPDPVIIPQRAASGQEFIACVGGASCLEADMLSWRKIRFQQPVQVGDACVYLNTAGYQMDSNESSFHEASIPFKVVIELHDYGLEWYLDEQAAYARPLIHPDGPQYTKHQYHQKSET